MHAVIIACHLHLSLESFVTPSGSALPLACGNWECLCVSVFLVLPSMFVLTGRLIKLSCLDQGHLECVCVHLQSCSSPILLKCMCVSIHVRTCFWPQPAEYPTDFPFSSACQQQWSGLCSDKCQAMWVEWSAPHSVSGAREGPSLYPDLVVLQS